MSFPVIATIVEDKKDACERCIHEEGEGGCDVTWDEWRQRLISEDNVLYCGSFVEVHH